LRARGKGNLRGLMTGYTFHLEGYPLAPGNGEYLVTSTKIDMVNNDTVTNRGALQRQFSVETTFTAQPANTFFRTSQKAKKPRSYGEAAVVTGPEKYPVWTDRYGRVLVRFIWERTKDRKEHYTSCWLRVSSPWHGAGYGAIWIPRVGHEVEIGYHNNDPDRPFVVGRHTNEFHEPPWTLPDNQALSGWRSQSLGGVEANSMMTDDTPGKLQVQVASYQAHSSRVGLGSITLIDGHKGCSTPRGEGFELATDAWGVARANKGLLITTEPRVGATAPVKDMGETLQRLTQAREQHETLANAAIQAQAHDEQDLTDIAKALKTQNDDIRGEGGDDAKNSSELAKPHLVLASPAGFEATTAGSTHLASGEHTALTSGGHVSMSSGKNLLASARDAIRLFAYKLGIRIVSFVEDIDITALKKNINLLAKLDITQTADGIVIKGTKQLLLGGGDSYIRLENGKITVGAMQYLVNAQISNLPPKPMGVNAQGLPAVEANDQAFRILTPSGLPLPGVAYKMTSDSGGHIFQTNQHGRSPILNTKQEENVKFAVHWDDLFTDQSK
jgi:type VI secretion system secreted protein VgrG